MLPFISYLTGKLYPALYLHQTPLKHLSPGQEFYHWPCSFSSTAARQIHGHSPPCPWPPQFCFLSWKQACSHIFISNAKATIFHQSHFRITQAGMRPPNRKGICRAWPPPLTCFPYSCQESSFKPGMRQTAHVSGSVLSAAGISLECAKSKLGNLSSALFLYFAWVLPSGFISTQILIPDIELCWGHKSACALSPVGFFEHQDWLSKSGYASQQV